MYLLDTNVVSELKRPRPHPAVVSWLADANPAALFPSAVTLAEIQAGIERTREHDPEKAGSIQAWADLLERTHTVLAMDAALFRLWARLMHRRPEHLYEDGMIAATALHHGLIVVTRNIRDFQPFGVETIDPFSLPVRPPPS